MAASADAGVVLELEAPAKVNLGLRIVGRRDDGYHLLESLFVPIDWADRVRVELDAEAPPGVLLRLEAGSAPAAPGSGVPAGPDNLAARAAEAFLERARRAAAVRISLDKRLPAAAGLGGGSSDAGAVLRALDRLLPGALPPGALADLALELGADVPFFLDPRPALVRGVGERIEPVEGLPGLWLVLANPGKSLATAAVYAAWDESAAALTPSEAGSTMRALSRLRAAFRVSSQRHDSRARHSDGATAMAPQSIASLGALLVNDLEPAARGLCPEVADLQQRLRSLGAAAAGMSGSGATVFGVFPDEASARAAHADLTPGPVGQPGPLDQAGPSVRRDAQGADGAEGAPQQSGGWARVVRSAASAAGSEGRADAD